MKRVKQACFLAIMLLLTMSRIYAQKYYKVIDATSTSFSGGMPQSGSGTTYNIKIVLTSNQKITFNNIWIGKEYGVPEYMSFSYADRRTLVKGDTAIVRYTVHHYPPGSPMLQMPAPAYKSPPIPIEGEALLGFTVGKATRYRSVGKFKEQAAHNYQ